MKAYFDKVKVEKVYWISHNNLIKCLDYEKCLDYFYREMSQENSGKQKHSLEKIYNYFNGKLAHLDLKFNYFPYFEKVF